MQLTISSSALKSIATDAFLIAVVCLVPAFSHWFSFPLYHLDPMRICLLVSMLLIAGRGHAFVLALLLPAVSCLLTAMPAPAIAAIIALELTVNVALFYLLKDKMNPGLALFLSIFLSKAVYYLCKMLLLAPAVLVSTAIGWQLAVMIVLSLLFAKFYKNKA